MTGPSENKTTPAPRTGGKKGAFVISLDFELFWGMRDLFSISEYGPQVLGARQAIPGMLELFRRFEIKTTIATVGFLFFATKKELLAGLPEKRPSYAQPKLSPYGEYLATIGEDEERDPYHYAPSLIERIARAGHEIGCHTFSHYYVLEQGQTSGQFRDDLAAACRVAARWNVQLKSIVFPRNQYSSEHLRICADAGLLGYRGNETSWAYSTGSGATQTRARRGARLLDAYFNLTGQHCHTIAGDGSGIVNIPSSRFLRPWSPKLRVLEPFRLRRITQGMECAARQGLAYHLWWHPHNFGAHTAENLRFLEKVLKRFSELRAKYGFENSCMSALAESVTRP